MIPLDPVSGCQKDLRHQGRITGTDDMKHDSIGELNRTAATPHAGLLIILCRVAFLEPTTHSNSNRCGVIVYREQIFDRR